MSPKFNFSDLQLAAIDFAARIHCTAAPADKDIIATYGGSLRLGFRIGSDTLRKFTVAMSHVETAEYRAFIVGMSDDDIDDLQDEIAKLVARLATPRKGVK